MATPYSTDYECSNFYSGWAAFPVYGSGNTAICPIDANSCCYNPGEDADGNAVGMCECVNKVCKAPVAFM